MEREIRIHSGLRHPNLITLLAAFENARHVVLVMEWAAGGDLYTALDRAGGQLSEQRTVNAVLVPFLRGMSYMHSKVSCRSAEAGQRMEGRGSAGQRALLYSTVVHSVLACTQLQAVAPTQLPSHLLRASDVLRSKQAHPVCIPLLPLQHIIHRDIKPENILLSSSSVIKLADFGLAIDCSQERPVTRGGTLDYMVRVWSVEQ